jgi:hypothetical protein
MLIDQPEAVELPFRQSGHAIRNIWLDFRGVFPDRGIRHSSYSFQLPFCLGLPPESAPTYVTMNLSAKKARLSFVKGIGSDSRGRGGKVPVTQAGNARIACA